ncbi:acyltransferase [Sphingomonas panacisoli]|uniref:Acyltransferase n=1 Tax=Sphingomonas panacisoli TaxID=1813879 RepID=A0A5B8LLS4_9SPHN|nr:acyltransferase family protein [Sphingomonas panacisoli]QDZ08020.1 acyltransferase [Sphingomonas panacisoli]
MTGETVRQPLGYIPAIDGLRALAVLSVVAYHLHPGMLPGGFSGVDIFFAISGFVVTGSMMGKSFDRLPAMLSYFYARRLVRIMPALLAMLLVAILVNQMLVPEAWLSRAVPQTARFAFFGLSNIILATDTDGYFGVQAGFNPFTHTWSLGVEEQFYLFFPLLLFWHQKLDSAKLDTGRAVRLIGWVSAASFVLCGVLTWVERKYAFYLIVGRFWELGLGMILCLTMPRWRPVLAAWPAARRRVLAAASVVAVVAALALPDRGGFPFPLAILPVIGTIGLIASVVAAPDAPITRAFASAGPVAIGRLSYSLYLWHWPVFVMFRWTVGLDTLPHQLAASALALLLAAASYFLVEQPFRRRGKAAKYPPRRVVGRMTIGTLACALLGFVMLARTDALAIGVTRDHSTWYADARHTLDPALSHCAVATDRVRRGGGDTDRWTPSDCTTRPAGFRVFAIGDSHSTAYAPNYRQLAAELGVPVASYFRPGCPFLRLIQPMDVRRRCADFYRAFFDDLRTQGRPGDVVFLPGLRITRLINQFGHEKVHDSPVDNSLSNVAIAEAQDTLARLQTAGFRIVIEAPKPIFPAPPFRCSDWYDRANPICVGGLTIARDRPLVMRRHVVDAMTALARRYPALSVWDPFPILCPDDPCRAIDATGRPLFFDGDHLSGHGNDMVYPAMRDAILNARL